ncbi:hypothetical protein ACLESD_43470 [Pyxidicoccus sp. 3LFB2]
MKRYPVAVLGALVLWLAPRAEAQSDLEEEGPYLSGVVLAEGPLNEMDIMGTAHRIACEGRFCLWRITEQLGPCAAYRCSHERLTTSDLNGNALGSRWTLSNHGETFVRFLGPHQVEVITRDIPGAEGTALPSGVDGSSIHREVLKLSRDGRKLTRDASATPLNPWQKGYVAPAPVRPPPVVRRSPVRKSVLARAQAVCDSGETLVPRHHECRDGTCVLILSDAVSPDGEPVREDAEQFCGNVCLVLVKGKELRRPPIGAGAECIRFTPTGYVFSGPYGPYGSREDFHEMSRLKPGYMSFGNGGGHVDGANPYPMLELQSEEAARRFAPTVHAYTVVHVTWGLKAWQGREDLSLAWQLMQVGDTLRLHAEVDDDVVVPFNPGAGTGVHSDHLELTVASPRGKSSAQQEGVPRKLGVLLADEGKAQVRLWSGEDDKPYAPARGTWTRSPRGYVVEVVLPLGVLQELKPLVAAQLTLRVSDADARGKQETLMGHDAWLRFWTEYPPSIDEYHLRTEGSPLHP